MLFELERKVFRILYYLATDFFDRPPFGGFLSAIVIWGKAEMLRTR